ncbi:MAG TPA: helix-turn-helix transcriptional regulator [Solirubrobacteraceae bacterium]|jgi:transcriptional regulator with XRE-family HTH domain|nr:helix-turn-helix transcriptional regulator [Solirubrobacteraceae bacterium]
MHLDELKTDAAVLAELGRRLTRHRLERNWTQAELAAEAGIGQATVQRAERGQSVQMTSMVKLLRTLELLGGLDAAIPESIDLPIAQLERERRGIRRRASGRSRPSADGRDDPPAGGRSRPRASGRDHPPAGGLGHPPAEPTDRPWTWGDEPGTAG